MTEAPEAGEETNEIEAAARAALRSPWRDWLLAEKTTRYRWTRFFILRLLGLLYLMGFWILVQQGLPLLGKDGLLPADSFVTRWTERQGGMSSAFWHLPSLFMITGVSDRWLLGLAWVGVLLSLLVLAGYANAIVMAVLWALYMSFVHTGQLFYGYGWEIQLLETGFLGVFLCAPLDPRPLPRQDPPIVVLWLYRWLILRIMLGAGLIKIRGDACWRDLSCLYFHYETQPIPNPLSPLFHFLPHWANALGVLFNHFCELVVPFFVFGPRRVRHIAGTLLLAFQCTLILSGNLAFLNWLTLIPIVACFDDSRLERLVPAKWRTRADGQLVPPARPQRIVVWGLAIVVGFLSLGPVANMLSTEQVMNTSFDPFDLVNTYGAFGSVGRERNEIVFEGTTENEVTANTTWKPYEFRCKPGDPERRPCWMSPYHYRVDWQIWFAAMTQPDQAPWTLHLVWKLLHADKGTLSLLAGDPFAGDAPRFIRATLYRYRFAPLGHKAWWEREELGPWLPPLSADDPRLRRFLKAYGWL
jgi:Lipase maturation factor